MCIKYVYADAISYPGNGPRTESIRDASMTRRVLQRLSVTGNPTSTATAILGQSFPVPASEACDR